MSDQDFTKIRWYMTVDDVCGGWSIVNVPGVPMSELDTRSGEEFEILKPLSEEVGHYVVSLHTYLHKARFPDQYRD
jgi:hypothetical protein